MSLGRLKARILHEADYWGGTFRLGDLPGTTVGRTGRISPSVAARVRRIRAAIAELVAEGRLAEDGREEWKVIR